MRVQRTKECRLGFIGRISNANVTDKELIEMFRQNTPNENISINSGLMHRVINYKFAQYYIFEEGNDLVVFKKLPLVHNDDIFEWSKAIFKVNTYLLSNIRIGILDYSCHYDEITERCTIEVRLRDNRTACHIRTLYIENATNERILDEIKKHRDNMTRRLNDDTDVVNGWSKKQNK